ncbi:MAG: isoprenylcysteine carboxylmethyltransferase family protein [Pseudomonadota bacterium]
MTLPAIMFLIFIITQRLGELYLAKRNTAALVGRGAEEHGAGHYPFMVALHTGWVIALVLGGYDKQVVWFWLGIFAILQIFRVWILVTLGDRWTTRIIVVDEPLVLAGPFRYFKHPNYILVIMEIFVAPMVLGLWQVAVVFSLLNALMLLVRIREEEKALEHLRNAGH